MDVTQIGAWMLVLVTALGPFEYRVTPLSDASDHNQCHAIAYAIDADIERQANQEMICIQVREDVASIDWPSE